MSPLVFILHMANESGRQFQSGEQGQPYLVPNIDIDMVDKQE